MKPSLLVLSSLYDFSVDVVLRRLQGMGVSYLRINSEQLRDLRVSIDPIAATMTVKGFGINATLDGGLHSVWYRSAVFPRNSQADRSPAQQLERTQWSAFMRGLMVFDRARWMNHPADTYKAESKPYQLLIASRCGFVVPLTVVGNDLATVNQHFDSNLALKSVDTVYLREKGDALFAYTNIVQATSLSDEIFHQAPSIAQEFVSPKVDLRVTVVGSSVFAYKILANGEAANGDWRLYRREELSYSRYELPDAVKQRCIALCVNLKIPFGAIDLMLRGEEFVFVEVNPTGEWAWLPDAAGTAGAAIAEWLADKRQTNV